MKWREKRRVVHLGKGGVVIVILAASLTFSTIVVNLADRLDASGGLENPLDVVSILVLPLITMAILLAPLGFLSNHDDELIAELRKGFGMLAERFDRQDEKLDRILDILSGEGKGSAATKPDDGKKADDKTSG